MSRYPDPICFDLCPGEILEEIATAPSLGIGIRTRALRYSREVEPASLFIADSEWVSLPATGLSVDPKKVCGIHARRGRIEFDFNPAHHRLDLSPGPELLDHLVLCHTVGAISDATLISARRAARPTLNPCPCCRKAAAERRANPESLPLFQILENTPRFHLKIQTPSFDISHHLSLRSMSTHRGFINLLASDGTAVRIDAGFIHCLLIQRLRIGGEIRPT
ncbi:MAG: hypothetical protein AAGB14_12440, partial [Verrucomicrobiota bacterium]